MCGITGIYNFSGQSINKNKLIEITDIISHRGPDDSGYFEDEEIGLGHRRLSIIDLSQAGHQPFLSRDGRFAIVFNGEIYNYKELTPLVTSRGVKIESNSDTEVLMYLLILYGMDVLEFVNGMFAFALWDSVKRDLIICRDRLGVKPLYFAEHNSNFVFSSEVKSLIKFGVPARINESAFEEFFTFRFVAGSNTLFDNIYKVLPGEFIHVTRKGLEKKRWWNLKTKVNTFDSEKISKPLNWFADTFESSLKYRMVSDVPVGVLLSGGLDSSSIAITLKKLGFDGINTFNVKMDDYAEDESGLAERLSAALGFNFFTKGFGSDVLLNLIKESTWFLDEPLIHMNDPHILGISKFANTKVKVLLSGEGADEILGGYVRYKAPRLINRYSFILKALNITKSNIKDKRIHKLLRYSEFNDRKNLIRFNSSNLFLSDLKELGLHLGHDKFEFRESVISDAIELYSDSVERQLMYFDQNTYLQSLLDRNDRATMGASIECREPFLDFRLVEGLANLPSNYFVKGKKGKFLLSNSIGLSLPDYIRTFKKVGFSIPWNRYLFEDSVFLNIINSWNSNEFEQFPILREFDCKTIFLKAKGGDTFNFNLLLNLFMIYVWKCEYLENSKFKQSEN
jgi:asparagine synthase (glutamine-hydrolysing)